MQGKIICSAVPNFANGRLEGVREIYFEGPEGAQNRIELSRAKILQNSLRCLNPGNLPVDFRMYGDLRIWCCFLLSYKVSLKSRTSSLVMLGRSGSLQQTCLPARNMNGSDSETRLWVSTCGSCASKTVLAKNASVPKSACQVFQTHILQIPVNNFE